MLSKENQEFIKEIKTNNIFKSKIDKLSKMTLKEILKDMSFKNRFFFSNQFLFKKTVKKLIDEKYIEVSKMLKTTVSNSDVLETVDDVYIDMTFELATHESTADVLLRLADYMVKYNIEYEILSIKAASKVTSLETKGYQIVKEVIESVYKDLYVVPTIITRISEKRYFDKVSDCVIRFSPLYYSMNAYRDALKGKEHISINSLSYGVCFFDKILKTYKRRL
jgi:carboxypeptidase PM20D1